RLQSLINGLGKETPGPESVQPLVSKLNDLRGREPVAKTASPEAMSTPQPAAGRAKVQIPAKHLAAAKEMGRYLSYVSLDLNEQGFTTLVEVSSFFDRLNGAVLMKGILSDRLGADAPAGTIPAYMLLITPEKPDHFLESNNVRFRKIKHLHQPAEIQAVRSGAEPSALEHTTTEYQADLSQKSEKRDNVETHLRVPFRLVDHLINLAGEAVIARNELVQRTASSTDRGLASVGKKISLLITNIQEGIMRTRLQELNGVFQRIPRIVRDATAATGKKVNVQTHGGEVELDKTLMDAVSESIMHVIRNAVDHGIEAPAERIRLGKPEYGVIHVSARMRGGNVVFEMRDDGRGIDVEKIRSSALSRGIMTADQVQAASRADLLELVFLPGFSTASKVTATSGRGVGMDVVRTSFERAGGSVEIASDPGRGTTIVASVPQTLTITTCLLVRTAGIRYALPQQNVT
ncbi:MAG: hypothetical protein HY042_03195, partial [Spirochaetia bacterium]|nr:hypothetical protein [Spirochaetia bacterium]